LGDAGVLAERLRELRARRDINAPDKRRLELILREIANLDGISLDDIHRPPCSGRLRRPHPWPPSLQCISRPLKNPALDAV
jgi:hypothetical protein